jgi:hypothetical protein
LISSAQKILDEFGVKLVKDTRKNYNDGQKKRSAKFKGTHNENSVLGASIRFLIKRKQGGIEFQLLMNDYWKYINDGRKKGPVSKEGQSLIEKWIKKKSIDAPRIIDSFKKPLKTQGLTRKPTSYVKAVKQLTYLIARKKKIKDTEGTGFLDKTLQDGRLDKLREDLTIVLRKDIKIQIISGSNDTSATS